MSEPFQRRPSTGALPQKSRPMTRKVTMTWQTLQDVLTAHLYATGAVRESRDVGDIWIKKIYEPSGEASAELTIELKD